MKKSLILVVAVLLLATFSFTKTTLDTLTFYTLDVETGDTDIFPIVYLTIEPVKGLGIRLEDYITLGHNTLSLGPINLMKPRFYYAYYQGEDLSLKVGMFRSKHYNTRKINLLRVGGFYDYNYGLELEYNLGSFAILGRYNHDDFTSQHQYGGMLAYKTRSHTLALYGMVKGNEYDLSADGSLKVHLGPVSGEIFGAVAAYGPSPFSAPPTYLIGTLVDWGKISAGLQYAKQGSWNIDYDFSDPNKGSNWVFNAFTTYHFTPDFSVGAFLDVNPSGYNYGTKFEISGLELALSNGDFNGGMSGTQRIQLSYSNYFSIDLEKPFKVMMKSAKRLPNIAEVRKTAGPGDVVTVKGVIAVDTGVLGNNTTYVVDRTGGYMLWGNKTEGLKTGDEVIVTGYIKEYYGILEIVPSSIEKISSGKEVPVIPVKIVDVFSGEYESALVQITGTVVDVQKYSIVVKDSTGMIKVYAKKGTNVSFKGLKFGQSITVVGIVSKYQGAWEILPRFQADIR